ncbi:MAG: amidase, partial [Bacteroidetes bacterium]
MRSLFLILSGALCGAFVTFTLTQRPITSAMIAEAEALIGLSFTPAERDSMREGLEDARESFDSLRAESIPNSLPPAFVFNPLPQGFQVPTGPDVVRIGKKKVMLPANREELAFYSARDLGELVRSRQITSVELTRFFIARLRRYDPQLHCVVNYMEESALARAAEMDKETAAGKSRGPLHGVPYGAKDLLATRLAATTFGATPYKDQQFAYDATVLRKLEEAGAILVAKLSLGELAMDDTWFGGRTRNPWNPETGSSGSSAGSASAVSAGLLPFAIGSETWGSIVSPATICGVTGLRPTFGQVSRYGAMALSWTMDKLGPMARSAEDCALVYHVIHGADPLDASSRQTPFRYDNTQPFKKLRIGYLKEDFSGNYAGRAADEKVLELLRSQGHELVPMSLPDCPDISFLLTAEAAAAFEELTLSNRDDLLVQQGKYNWPNFYRTARFVPAVEYIQANRLRSRLIEQTHAALKGFDLIVAPSLEGSSLLLTNLTGHPSITV